MKKPAARILTGHRPTGPRHIGHLVGTLQNWVKLQDTHQCFFLGADIHVLTTDFEHPGKIGENTLEMVYDWLAAGIDPRRSTLVLQSAVPEHTVLCVLLSMLTPVGRLERVPTYKDQVRELGLNPSLGLLAYPVLQAADILLYKGEVVPVGEDQVQHVEFTREVARHFNSRYGQTFPECQALLTKTPRVLGLDGDAKMSKSKGNTIGVLETAEQIWAKVGPAKTDPARVRRTDPGTPEKCTIWSYHLLVTKEPELTEIHDGCTTAGIGCIDCKKRFQANLMKVLDPVRERHAELAGSGKKKVEEKLEANAVKCRAVAGETIREAKGKMGLKKVWKIES